jgi:hypothetical protein
MPGPVANDSCVFGSIQPIGCGLDPDGIAAAHRHAISASDRLRRPESNRPGAIKVRRMSNASLRFDATGEVPLRTGIMIAVDFLSRSDLGIMV